MKLEDIQPGNIISGVVPAKAVSVVAREMRGETLELTYRLEGALGQRLLLRADEARLSLHADRLPKGRLADAKTLAIVALTALALIAFLLWVRARPDTSGPVSNDMPVVIRTNGGMLEVATVKHRRTFNLTNMHVILGYAVPFCKERASYTVDAYFYYRVKLAKRWYASYDRQRLQVTAPRLEPALPVAFDTSGLRPALQKCAVMPSLDTQNDLLRSVSATLEKDSRSAAYVEFARDHGARDTVREFVRKWLVSQQGYNIPTTVPIDVAFDDE